jgi:hypothetical protein
MLRNFGISLMLLGLLAAGVDGFRTRERVRTGAPSNTAATTEDSVHMSEAGVGIIPPR